MKQLTSEQRETVRRKEVANILAALNAGKRITREQRHLLDEATTEDPGKYAANWHELAISLKRSRRCLTKWREKYKDSVPKPRADGRHVVGDWLRFMDKNGLADEPDPEDDGLPPKAHWDRERARIDFEQAVYNFAVKREQHLPIDQITGAVGQMLAGFRTALNTMPSSAARWLIGLRDFNAIKDKLQDEVDAVLQALGRCDYLETLTQTVVAKIFPDRDEAARAEIARATDSVFCELGRLALSDLLQRQLPPSEEQPASRQTDNERKEISPDPIEPGPSESDRSNKPDKSPRKPSKKK